MTLPVVYLARHGETAWTLSGQHTGLTDQPLMEKGEQNARRLRERLNVAEVDYYLVEWNYGDYEGRRGADICAERPGWRGMTQIM